MDYIRIYNQSKQMIPLSLCPPGGDFFRQQHTAYVGPGKHVTVPKSHVNENQINNLQKKRLLKVLVDTEK